MSNTGSAPVVFASRTHAVVAGSGAGTSTGSGKKNAIKKKIVQPKNSRTRFKSSYAVSSLKSRPKRQANAVKPAPVASSVPLFSPKKQIKPASLSTGSGRAAGEKIERKIEQKIIPEIAEEVATNNEQLAPLTGHSDRDEAESLRLAELAQDTFRDAKGNQNNDMMLVGEATSESFYDPVYSALSQHWSVPAGLPKGLVCTVIIMIDIDGKSTYEFIRKSGILAFDTAVRTTLLRACYPQTIKKHTKKVEFRS